MADDDSRVQQRANAVVSLMTFTVVPDITASNINIGSGTNQSSALNMTQIGGGATMSGASRFIWKEPWGSAATIPSSWSATAASRTVPTKWNSLTATGGIGWDIGLHRDSHGGNWVLRPIGNVTLGTVASDLRIGNWLLGQYTGKNLDFLDGGRLDVYGLGGAMMLDYELFSPARTSTPSCATPISTCRALAAPPPV